MRRWEIKLAAAAVAVMGMMGSFALALVIVRIQAIQEQQDDLTVLNLRLLRRAELVAAGAADAIRLIARTPVEVCSPAHIEAMLRVAVNNRFIDGLGYVSQGRLRCTGWGPVHQDIAVPAPDFFTRDGLGVVASMRPRVSATDPRVVIYLDKYDALINPERFIDIFSDNVTQLAVAGETGTVLATQNRPDPGLLNALLANPHTGQNDNYVYSAVAEKGWIIASMRPKSTISARRNEIFFLPLALLVAAAIVGAVVFLAHRRLSPEGELSAAIRARRMFVVYQPVIELATGVCVGAEALVRWRRDDGLVVSPNVFIPIAEANGMTGAITRRVIEEVIADLRPMLAAEPLFHVGINLSAEDISSGKILDFLQRALKGTGIMPKQIWLEMTERGFVAVDKARDTMDRARRPGHPIAIDDFGTGYSALQYLQTLPLDALKIDKSFVDTVGYETAFSPVTPHIIQMAATLGLHCVAEGIETKEQCDYLAARGVEYGQGWFFSEPVSACALRAFYSRRRTAHLAQDFSTPPDRQGKGGGAACGGDPPT